MYQVLTGVVPKQRLFLLKDEEMSLSKALRDGFDHWCAQDEDKREDVKENELAEEVCDIRTELRWLLDRLEEVEKEMRKKKEDDRSQIRKT